MISKSWRYYAAYPALRAVSLAEVGLARLSEAVYDAALAADALYIRVWNWTQR